MTQDAKRQNELYDLLTKHTNIPLSRVYEMSMDEMKAAANNVLDGRKVS